jgi:hypothetical protein
LADFLYFRVFAVGIAVADDSPQLGEHLLVGHFLLFQLDYVAAVCDHGTAVRVASVQLLIDHGLSVRGLDVLMLMN